MIKTFKTIKEYESAQSTLPEGCSAYIEEIGQILYNTNAEKKDRLVALRLASGNPNSMNNCILAVKRSSGIYDIPVCQSKAFGPINRDSEGYITEQNCEKGGTSVERFINIMGESCYVIEYFYMEPYIDSGDFILLNYTSLEQGGSGAVHFLDIYKDAYIHANVAGSVNYKELLRLYTDKKIRFLNIHYELGVTGSTGDLIINPSSGGHFDYGDGDIYLANALVNWMLTENLLSAAIDPVTHKNDNRIIGIFGFKENIFKIYIDDSLNRSSIAFCMEQLPESFDGKNYPGNINRLLLPNKKFRIIYTIPIQGNNNQALGILLLYELNDLKFHPIVVKVKNLIFPYAFTGGEPAALNNYYIPGGTINLVNKYRRLETTGLYAAVIINKSGQPYNNIDTIGYSISIDDIIISYILPATESGTDEFIYHKNFLTDTGEILGDPIYIYVDSFLCPQLSSSPSSYNVPTPGTRYYDAIWTESDISAFAYSGWAEPLETT